MEQRHGVRALRKRLAGASRSAGVAGDDLPSDGGYTGKDLENASAKKGRPSGAAEFIGVYDDALRYERVRLMEA
jgi:hypothetical protein